MDNNETSIDTNKTVVIWTVADIKKLRPDLTDYEVEKVVKYLSGKYFESNYVLASEVNTLYPNYKVSKFNYIFGIFCAIVIVVFVGYLVYYVGSSGILTRPYKAVWMQQELSSIPFKEYKVKDTQNFTQSSQPYILFKLTDSSNGVTQVSVESETITYRFSDKGYSYVTLKYLDHDIDDKHTEYDLSKGAYYVTYYK